MCASSLQGAKDFLVSSQARVHWSGVLAPSLLEGKTTQILSLWQMHWQPSSFARAGWRVAERLSLHLDLITGSISRGKCGSLWRTLREEPTPAKGRENFKEKFCLTSESSEGSFWGRKTVLLYFWTVACWERLVPGSVLRASLHQKRKMSPKIPEAPRSRWDPHCRSGGEE